MNHNTDYEQFTQRIYQSLIEAQGIDNILVKHDVSLEGKSGQKHQIDVYWEYEIAGIRNKVIIECKNYNKEVSIAKVRDFSSVLSDLNNVSGIMVTKIGYQSGAKKFASFYGINLKELRKLTDEELANEAVGFILKFSKVEVKNRKCVLDKDWFLKNDVLPPEAGEFTVYGKRGEILIYDQNGNILTNFQELESQLPHNFKEVQDIEETYTYENAFIDTKEYGRVKLKSLTFQYDVVVWIDASGLDGIRTVEVILRDALTGELKHFDKDGKLI